MSNPPGGQLFGGLASPQAFLGPLFYDHPPGPLGESVRSTHNHRFKNIPNI